MATQGERLKELMAQYEISQTDLSKKLGIPRSSMSMYVDDKRKMKQNRLKAISDMFGVSEAWLMGFDTPKNKTVISVVGLKKAIEEAMESQDNDKSFIGTRNVDEVIEVGIAYSNLDLSGRNMVRKMLDLSTLKTLGESYLSQNVS